MSIMLFPYITTGYRRPTDNVRLAVWSMFSSLHNETINAWTIVMNAMILFAVASMHRDVTMYQVTMMIGILQHAPISFMYHTMLCSPKYANICRKLDILSISIASVHITMALGGAVFGLRSLSTWLLFLMSLMFCYPQFVYVAEPSSTRVVSIVEKQKTLVYVASGVLVYNIPIIYSVITSPVAYTRAYGLFEVISIAIATIFYVTDYPEKYHPGRYDLIGSSHQWAHLFLILQQLSIWYFLKAYKDI
jgi:adiponectin receptor